MNGQRLTAFLLIVIGVLTLAYGGFSYTKETHKADIGSLHMSVDEKQYVNMPVWVGIGALVMGGILLIGKKV
jgi:uncharacterized membrane protein YidH (DUF202 family)